MSHIQDMDPEKGKKKTIKVWRWWTLDTRHIKIRGELNKRLEDKKVLNSILFKFSKSKETIEVMYVLTEIIKKTEEKRDRRCMWASQTLRYSLIDWIGKKYRKD